MAYSSLLKIRSVLYLIYHLFLKCFFNITHFLQKFLLKTGIAFSFMLVFSCSQLSLSHKVLVASSVAANSIDILIDEKGYKHL